jgi:hypothetical protein
VQAASHLQFRNVAGGDDPWTFDQAGAGVAAIGRRAPESEAVRQHAEDDRGAASAGRVAKQK